MPLSHQANVTVNESLLVSLSSYNSNENDVTLKYQFTLSELLRDYPNSFNLHNVAELSRNRIDRKGVQVNAENGKIAFTAHLLHKTFHFVILSRTANKCTKI